MGDSDGAAANQAGSIYQVGFDTAGGMSD